jgi:hypothetical protein
VENPGSLDKDLGMESTPEGLPPSLRFLKALVIVLTITMIGGVITVVGLLVTRMPKPQAQLVVTLPEALVLPKDAKALAITAGPGWYAVVTTDSRILIFDGATGRLRQEVTVAKAAPAP